MPHPAYRLGPLQTGMLFHVLLDPSSRANHQHNIEQLWVRLDEAIKLELFSAAWATVLHWHAVLSNRFLFEGQESPTQQADFDCAIPIVSFDWDDLGEHDFAERQGLLLDEDRARRFDLSRPPLTRVTVLRIGPHRTDILWTYHHILLDGQSAGHVMVDVLRVYDALADGKPIPQPREYRPYSDYIGWLEGLDASASRGYFRQLLHGLSAAPTPLPWAEPPTRPLQRSGYYEAVLALDENLSNAIRHLSSSTNTSLTSIAQAAWAILLSRYALEVDVVFGAVVDGRASALDGTATSTVGLFLNTLPVRLQIAGGSSVAELLAEVQKQHEQTASFAHTPLAHVQEACSLHPSCPLYEMLLRVERPILLQTKRNGQEQQRSTSFACELHEWPAIPLTVTVVDAEQLVLRALCDKQRFTIAAANRLVTSLAHVLRELSLGENRSVALIEAIPVADRNQLLIDWNDTERPFPDDLLIHELFEQQADCQPASIALEFDGHQVSFGQLERLANRLAHALRARGAKPGRFVALCLGRGIDLVVTLLGIAKSGAAYLPIDPSYPAERLAFMAKDADAILTVTEVRYSKLLESTSSGPLLVIDGDDKPAIAQMPDSRPDRVGTPVAPCYAIYTSGSTGTPKGVVLSHRAVVNTFDWVNRTFEIGPSDRLLFVTSPCFDLSVYDTFGALGAGATVVIASEETLRDPQLLATVLIRDEISVWDSAPQALQRLVPYFTNSNGRNCLRLVMLSGDWIPLGLPDAIRRAHSGARVISLGGATEAAIWSNWFPIGEVDPNWVSIPYGQPIQNARYYVLDDALRPVPIGAVGELFIGGICLADGYLNRPDLTKERFLPAPFLPGAAARVYRTGDLARYYDNGQLELIGRADFQVKVRGFRVELGEIEAVLARLDGVREAACATHRDASDQTTIVAYVVAHPGASLTASSIRTALSGTLPDFMLPSQVEFLDSLPLSANGKLDRKALPNPGETAAIELQFVPPNGDIECELAQLWQELLGRKQIGALDHFFEVGGHSLLATTLIARLLTRYGLALPLRTIFDSPVLRNLADLVDSALLLRERGLNPTATEQVDREEFLI